MDNYFLQVISIVLKDFEDSGPGDFTTEFELTAEEYQRICQDSRGGIEGFADRVQDILEAAIKDLTTFNGKPTSERTTITNIFTINHDEKDTEYPYTFSIGFRQEDDDE